MEPVNFLPLTGPLLRVLRAASSEWRGSYYYHQVLGAVIVHPDQAQVLPLFPEAITHQDGATKNDCESNASKRLLPELRKAFPTWPLRWWKIACQGTVRILSY